MGGGSYALILFAVQFFILPGVLRENAFAQIKKQKLDSCQAAKKDKAVKYLKKTQRYSE
jgi:hypothetical protein